MIGINIIGHVGASSGLGNTARLFARALMHSGIEVAMLDIDGSTSPASNRLADVLYAEKVADLPFDINLVIASIQIFPSMWQRRLPELASPRFRNIGLVFWELPVIPKAWIPSLQMFDVIAVSSYFIRSAIELAAPGVPTVYAEHPLDVSTPSPDFVAKSQAWRDRLGFTEQEVVYASSFDLRSDFARKNPLAAVEAFRKAFDGADQGARLLLKANGLEGSGSQHARAARILDVIADDRRIVLFRDTISYTEVMSLYASVDVFMSLHRAEGLGLGPLEAMRLGKPVVATGFSGNMTYMTEANSVAVPYRLVRPNGAAWQFSEQFAGKGAFWAEPDIEAAAAALKRLHSDQARRRQLGQVAQQDILRRQEAAWNVGFIEQAVNALRQAPNSLARAKLLRQVRLMEVLDRTLRAKNFDALKQRLTARWRVP